MQMLMEAQLLSVQLIKVDGSTYAKAFVASSPDGKSEAIAAVTSMNLVEENAESIFRYVQEQGIQLGEKVRLSIKAVRGSQNTVKNVIESIERLARPTGQQQPAAQQAQAKDK